MAFLSFDDWRLWLIIVILIIFLLWLFVGRNRKDAPEFVGLRLDDDITEDYLTETITNEMTNEMTNEITEISNEIPEVKQTKQVCFRSLGERLCCAVMEKIYQVPFRTVRLDVLRNPETGHNLEIDCYNDALKLGIEYNGEQHYVYPNKFHRDKLQFINQVRRDQYKIEACDRAGIYLITVPFTVPLNEKDIEAYIRQNLPENVCMKDGVTEIISSP